MAHPALRPSCGTGPRRPRQALGEDGSRAAVKRRGPRRALAHAGASARGIVRRSHRRQYVRSSTTRTALIVVAIRAAAVGAVAVGAVGAVARDRAGENFRGVALLSPPEPERISGLQCLQVASFGSLGLTANTSGSQKAQMILRIARQPEPRGISWNPSST